ncbi:hypothetical protein PAXRUDRAFT_157537, partial [Paxillus rubicundulus Ve08.2h10]
QMMKDWTSPIYAFFKPRLQILKVDSHCTHKSKCSACGCKVKIQCYLDMKDVWLFGNMQNHVKICWGMGVLPHANKVKNSKEVQMKITGSILWIGPVSAAFKRKGKVVYFPQQHTHTETRWVMTVYWVSEILHPSRIASDRGFQSLMKTGRPEYYLPSPLTVSQDVKLLCPPCLAEYSS